MSKILNAKLVHFSYDVKIRLLAHSRIFVANEKARNAIVVQSSCGLKSN